MFAYSKQVKRLITSLVNNYSKLNQDEKKYYIALYDIPNFDLDSLAAYLISENDSLSNEATSCDNPLYKTVMLPAMIKFMNSTDPDDQIEFARDWKSSVTDYCLSEIRELLDREIEEKNWEAPWAA